MSWVKCLEACLRRYTFSKWPYAAGNRRLWIQAKWSTRQSNASSQVIHFEFRLRVHVLKHWWQLYVDKLQYKHSLPVEMQSHV